MRGPSTLQNLLMQLSLPPRTTAGFCYEFSASSVQDGLRKQRGNVAFKGPSDLFALPHFKNSPGARVLSICAHSNAARGNAARDAAVRLTLRGCIIQFIYLMRPRLFSNSCLFPRWKIKRQVSLNHRLTSQPHICFVSGSKQTRVFPPKKVHLWAWERAKGQQAPLWNAAKRIINKKIPWLINTIEWLWRISIDVILFKTRGLLYRPADTMTSLCLVRVHRSEASDARIPIMGRFGVWWAGI